MKVKPFSKSHCSKLVMLAGSLFGKL